MTETTAATTHHRYQGTLGASTFRSAKAETWLATCALAAITKHENRRTTSRSTFEGEGSDPAVPEEPGEGGSAGYSRTSAIDNRQLLGRFPKLDAVALWVHDPAESTVVVLLDLLVDLNSLRAKGGK